MRDERYLKFQSKLLPTIAEETMIGVRVPQLRAYGRNMSQTEREALLSGLPHTYYEENMLHAFLINDICDFDLCMQLLDDFLPYVDNWAVCDGLRPKCLKNHRQALLPSIRKWLRSQHPYTIRFAIEMLMVHYLDEDFDETYPKMVSEINSNEYYVNMMIAWYFATALSKQYDAVIGYISGGVLSAWVHNKTIQKAIESYRITQEQKAELRVLRKKECS